MTSTFRARFRVPISIAAGGSLIAAAEAIGHGWVNAIGVEIFALIVAYGMFLVGGTDGDAGALMGARLDERQRVVALRAQTLAFRVMYVIAYIGLAIMIARGGQYWQFDVVGSIGGLTMLLGLKFYGIHDDS